MRAEADVFLAVFAGTLLVYFFTSAPGLGLVDSGELTTVAHTLSIAHPTGYPLYTVAGRVWDMLVPGNAARAMVLFSVVCGALACGVLSWLALRMLRYYCAGNARMQTAAAALLAVSFGLSAAIWSSVAFAEVYPLTLLIAATMLAATWSLWSMPDEAPALRITIFIAYLWGLGFGNHFTILWFFPLVAWAGVRAFRQSARRRQAVVLVAAAIAAGVSINLFLPIRSALEPPFDWSDPQKLSHLLRHLSAWQYRVWMFKGSAIDFLRNAAGYMVTLPADMGWPLFLLTTAGSTWAIMRRLWLVMVTLSIWLLGVVYNLNYSIPDISTYFTAFYAPLFVAAVIGFAAGVHVVQRKFSTVAADVTAVTVAITVLLVTVASSYPEADHSEDTFATDHALAILETLPDSAIVLHGNWDIQSPVDYLQTVEGVRRDIVLLDLALLQRPWYIKQEKRRHPAVFANCEREIQVFEQAVAPFEAGNSYSGGQIEDAYVRMANCIIESHYRTRPVYVRDTRSVGHPGVASQYPSYPGSYFFRIRHERLQEPMLDADRLTRSPGRIDERKQYLLRQAAVSAAMQGTFAASLGDTARVVAAAVQARKLAPFDPAIQRFLIQVMPFLPDSLNHP